MTWFQYASARKRSSWFTTLLSPAWTRALGLEEFGAGFECGVPHPRFLDQREQMRAVVERLGERGRLDRELA
ncbi:hypothetical protein R1A27_14305 [Methylobacterium sp. NMS12]|uniref:hypothetical protein n=1 Tax=Methylobacterium sp. NMS12 TaxID=3079766 RepID=UPI003F884480